MQTEKRIASIFNPVAIFWTVFLVISIVITSSSMALPTLNGVQIESGTGTSYYEYNRTNDIKTSFDFYEFITPPPESCDFPGGAFIFNIAYNITNTEDWDQNKYVLCRRKSDALTSVNAVSYNYCRTCSWQVINTPSPLLCGTYPIESSTIGLASGSYNSTYYQDYFDPDAEFVRKKCNITEVGKYVDTYTTNRSFILKYNKQIRSGSKLLIKGTLNVKNSNNKPDMEEFTINGLKPKTVIVAYYRYDTYNHYHNMGGSAEWEVPLSSASIGDVITLAPIISSGFGEVVFSSIEVVDSPCNLEITSLTNLNDSNNTIYPILGTIADSSGKTINWTATVADRTFNGTGKVPSFSWDGKDNNGQVVPEGTYQIILTAKTADETCSDSKIIPITVKSACNLKITNLTGTSKMLDPSAGGSVGISGAISDSSGKPLNWTLNVHDQTFTGTDKSVNATWNGKYANDTVVQPGEYSAVLSAFSADGQCKDSKSIKFTVSPAPDGQCGLYVQFGSSAHMASGNLSHSQDLFSSRGGALPAGMSLHYNSLDPADGTLGRGWSHSYDASLKQNSDGSVLISEPNWKYKYYTLQNGVYVSQPGNYSMLVKKVDGSFTMTSKEGQVTTFSRIGKLASISDRIGNTLKLAYSGNNLSSVTDSSDRTINFAYDASNHMISITDPSGNANTFSVAGNSLISVSHPDGGVWKYTYDANGYMLTKSDPLGNVTNYSYDDKHRAISSRDPDGRIRSIAYPQTTETVKSTAFIEKDGGVWQYNYDTQKGYLLGKTDPQGGTTSYGYDSNGNRISTTGPDGTVTTYTYDASGNMLTSTDALGQTTSYIYNAFGHVMRITDPQGGITAYVYDAKGNMTSLTDPTGTSTTYAYDAKGNMTKVTSATGQTTTFTYDARGNLASVADPAGVATSYAYDAVGNLTSITDAKGAVTQFVYDARSHVIKTIDAQGNATLYSYDTNGNKLSESDANSNTTKFEYNSRNQLIKTVDALGSITSYVYGGSACPSCGGGNGDKLTSITDANGNITSYLYDQLGRSVKEADPLGNSIVYDYDARNNPISKTDANGNTINYSYDANGRLLKKSYPDSTEETFTYDAKGNLLTAGNKHISYTFSYDAVGRIKSVSDSTGNVISYEYDLLGNKTKIISPEGKSLTYTYDKANRLTSIINGGTFTFGYDSKGQRSSLTYPNGDTAAYGYDKHGRLTSLVHKNSAGNVISSNSYTLDKIGNRQTNTTQDRTSNFSYDAIYRLTQTLTNTTGYSTNTNAAKGIANAVQQQKDLFNYDPVGNRLTTADNRKYTYGLANQLISKNGSTYNYDKNGNLVQKTTATETTTYTWDFENRLINAATPTSTSEFAYDPFGRRIEKKVTESGITNATKYFYDNQAILFDYDESSAISNHYIHGPNIDEPLVVKTGKDKYYYHADGLGSIIALTDQSGKVIQNFEYDSFGNMKDLKSRIKQPFTYTGREWDRETGLYYYRARYYDPMDGRFIQKDPIGFKGGINLYAYTMNNPINFTDPLGLWQYLPGSGNKWCGPNWTGGTNESFTQGHIYDPPSNGLDSCCMDHDICYSECRKNNACDLIGRDQCMTKCDRKLATCAASAGNKYSSPLWWWMNFNSTPDPGPDAPSCSSR